MDDDQFSNGFPNETLGCVAPSPSRRWHAMARREMRGDDNGQMAGLTGGRACDEGGSTKQDGAMQVDRLVLAFPRASTMYGVDSTRHSRLDQ
ncbi:hypothetical protein H9L39_18237 [Fusarium oxysporum f. sp. albedinis]|nr:hypothetical protein H9L39_18237 [Fusarium oxysporum f. sp. albedinis]